MSLILYLIFTFGLFHMHSGISTTRDLTNAIRKKKAELYQQLDDIIFHQDNAPAHTAVHTHLEFELLGFERLQNPPYSPDLASMDFAVFPKLHFMVLNSMTLENGKEPP